MERVFTSAVQTVYEWWKPVSRALTGDKIPTQEQVILDFGIYIPTQVSGEIAAETGGFRRRFKPLFPQDAKPNRPLTADRGYQSDQNAL
jgi:hypothetical protein